MRTTSRSKARMTGQKSIGEFTLVWPNCSADLIRRREESRLNDRGRFVEVDIMAAGIRTIKLAEREGFEPSVPVTQYARLAIPPEPDPARYHPGRAESVNPCGSWGSCSFLNSSQSYPIALHVLQLGKFTPPWPHPLALNASSGWVPAPPNRMQEADAI